MYYGQSPTRILYIGSFLLIEYSIPPVLSMCTWEKTAAYSNITNISRLRGRIRIEHLTSTICACVTTRHVHWEPYFDISSIGIIHRSEFGRIPPVARSWCYNESWLSSVGCNRIGVSRAIRIPEGDLRRRWARCVWALNSASQLVSRLLAGLSTRFDLNRWRVVVSSSTDWQFFLSPC